ncbi:MAG: DUF2069 domain-containing protein [Rubrivivax sp.]|nr:DUF2069 domain-containing protein [Rubrivivax sp.]
MTLPFPARHEADAPTTPDAVVRSMRALALAGTAGLVLLGLAWELWLAPTGSGTLAIKVLPLAFCLPGLLRHRMYTYRWLSLLVWLYFMEGVVRATTEGGLSQALAVVEIALTLLLFAACAMYIRWRLRSVARLPDAA